MFCVCQPRYPEELVCAYYLVRSIDSVGAEVSIGQSPKRECETVYIILPSRVVELLRPLHILHHAL